MMRTGLLALAAELAARGERFALATVVRREPPSSARVGDTALVTQSGEVHGWVGGGCTFSTLLREALRALSDGEPRLLRLSPDPAPVSQPGVVALPMTCKSGGTVELYVEAVVPPPRVLITGRRRLRTCLRASPMPWVIAWMSWTRTPTAQRFPRRCACIPT